MTIKGRKQMRWTYFRRKDWFNFVNTFDPPWWGPLMELEHWFAWRKYKRWCKRRNRGFQ